MLRVSQARNRAWLQNPHGPQPTVIMAEYSVLLYRVQQPELMDGPALELSAEDWNRLERLNKLRRTFALFNPQCWNIELKLLLTLIPLALNAMFRFVTIIPLHFWVIVLLLLLIWAAFGLGGLVVTAVGIMFFG
jgi:hypothetical protein